MGRTLPSTGTWWGLLKLNIERIWEWWWNNDDNHDQRISWPAEARDAELCTIKGKSKVEPMAISWQSQLWWWSSLSMYNRWLLHLRFKEYCCRNPPKIKIMDGHDNRDNNNQTIRRSARTTSEWSPRPRNPGCWSVALMPSSQDVGTTNTRWRW